MRNDSVLQGVARKLVSAPWGWLWIAVAIFIADYFTKVWASESLVYGWPRYVQPWLNWTLAHNTGEALSALRAAGLGAVPALSALETAWRLEQDLSQLLKVALEDGTDPDQEPKAFKALLARAGHARTFATLKTRLARAKLEARAAFEAVMRAER